MKIYTKGGDKGQTSLFGGRRVPKFHDRIEAYGTVDELNAVIGSLIGYLPEATQSMIHAELLEVQRRLFSIGGSLASDPEKQAAPCDLRPEDLTVLEKGIDRMTDNLPPLKNFILPGGSIAIAQAHLARCVCRRAERRVVALHQQEKVDSEIIQYLNRLSDYFFILARQFALDEGVEEIIWQARG